MSTTLYRKYRPQTWSAVVDQNHVKITLQHEIEQGKLTHAYLFSGGRGLGKTTIARLLAKSVNCTARKKGSAEPCGACVACTAIREGSTFDILEIDAASHTGVDNVRENIIASSRVPPAILAYKIFIIDEVHMLSTAAFNALLKTLEEPPPRIIFILATTELHRVPETIVSRCQRFDFRPIPQRALVERLRFIATEEGIRVDTEVLGRIADSARGSVRDAESLLGQVFALGEKHVKLESASLVLPHADHAVTAACFRAIVLRDPAALLQCLDQCAAEGADAVHVHGELVRVFRAALLARCGVMGAVLPDVIARDDARLLERADQRTLLSTLDALLACDDGVRHNEEPFVVLEVALLKTFADMPLPASGGIRVPSADTAPSNPRVERASAPARQKTSASTDTNPRARVSLVDMQARWDDIVHRVEETHRALALVVQVGYPVAIDNGVVAIGLEYDFHRERLADPQYEAAVRQAIQDVCGVDVRVVPQAASRQELDRLRGSVSSEEKKSSTSDPVLAQILTTFGGEVV